MAADDIVSISGKDLIDLARKNGSLEESIRRNSLLIDENTRKAEELEKRIIALNIEYESLNRQVTELDGTVHKGTASSQPLTQQVAVMKTEFISMKRILAFIATMSVTGAIQLAITIIGIFTKKGI